MGQTAWEDKLRLTMWVTANEFSRGETLWVKVVLENLTDELVGFTMWNYGDPAIQVHVEQVPLGETGYSIMLRSQEDPDATVPEVTYRAVPTTEDIERIVSWDGKAPRIPNRLDAPAGRYRVVATFFPGTQLPDQPWHPVQLAHDIQLKRAVTR